MIPTLSADELAALQLDRLQWTLRHAYENVPLYTKKFDAAGVHPNDCRGLDDLATFPFTTKQDLRGTYPFGMFAVPQNKIRRIHASSGTTGQPTIVGYTEADIETWSNVMARSLWAAGARPGHKVHVAYGYGLFTGGLGAHYGAERLGCTVIPASGGMTARQVRLITDLEPDIIMVTPSYMLTLLDEFERAGIDPAASSLQVGVFGAEPWTEQMRTEIETRLAIDAVDIYGLSEVIGPGVAQESAETKDGLHIWEDHFYPEVIDPATGDPAETQGELVFTSLTKQAMPIIRYRTRDLSRLLPSTAHPPFRRMAKVTGRSDDLIILRGVNVFPTQIEEIILTTPGAAPHFQLVLSKADRMDHLTVRVEAAPRKLDPASRSSAQKLDPASRSSVDTSANDIATRVKEDIGITVAVEILPPGTLERSSGKLQRVVDHR